MTFAGYCISAQGAIADSADQRKWMLFKNELRRRIRKLAAQHKVRLVGKYRIQQQPWIEMRAVLVRMERDGEDTE